MQVVYERCCGLDVHKRTVVACVLVTHPDGTVQREVRTFGTMTADLLALSDWLGARGGPDLARVITAGLWQTRSNQHREGGGPPFADPPHLQNHNPCPAHPT